MTNFVPLQIDKDTGRTVATRSGLGIGSGGIPPNFFDMLGYVHIETTPLATWVINHNADSPHHIVQVFDSVGRLIIPNEVIPIDGNTLHVTFTTPMSGKAVILFIQV